MTNCVDGVCGTGGYTGPLPGDPDNNSILTATAAFGGIDLSWTYPAVNPYAVAHINVFRGVNSVFGAAVLRAVATGNYHFDAADPGVTYYYWIQIVSVNGTVGAAIGPASAIAKSTIEKTIADLTGVIDSSLLAQSLNTELGKISDLTAGLSGEIENRTAANTALSLTLNTLNADLAQTTSYVQAEIALRAEQNATLVANLNAQVASTAASIDVLNAQVAGITGSPDYNNATAYPIDQVVKYNGSLYKSTVATTGHLPTDTNYWVKIGDYTSIGDAVAGHAILLSEHDTRITSAESGLTSEASNRVLLATKMTGLADPTTSTLASLSSGLLFDERSARSTADSTEVSARQTLSTTVIGATDATGKTLDNITSGILFDEKTARSTADATEVTARQLLSTTVIGATDPTGKTLANITSGILYDERTARSTADDTEVTSRQSLSTKVVGVPDHTSVTLATLSSGLLFDEKTARSTADSSEVTARQTLSTALIGATDPTGKTLANISTGLLFDEKTARSTADASEVTARQLISTKLVGVTDPTSVTLANVASGIIFDEKTARSTADASEVTARQLISTSLLGGVDPTGKTLANLTSGIIFDEKTARSTETTALASRASTLEASVNNGTTGLGTKASVAYVDTAKADAISASAATINLLEAKVVKTRKWENTALVNGNDAALVEATLKNIDNTTILDSGAVFGGYGPVSYRVDARTTGTATVTGATSIFTSTWNGSAWVWTQRVINELGTSSNHPRLYLSGGVPAIRMYLHTSTYPVTYTVSANVASYSPEAAILVEQTARVDADSALAGQITTVQSSAAGNLATVQTNLTTSINAVDGKVMSMYTAKVDVNGLIGGFGIYNNGAAVDAGFDVDTFWVGRTTNKIKPFIVTGSTVYINEAAIGKLTANIIDTRGLSIKDPAGNVIMAAGTGLGFNARFGGNTTNLPADNATSGKSLVKPLNQWNLSSQVITTVSDGKIGSEVLRLAGGLGYSNAGVFYPIDRTKTYRTRFWARPSADNASGLLYFCLRQCTDTSGTGTAGNGGRSPYKPSGWSRAMHIGTYGDTWGEYTYTWTNADWQTDMKYVIPDFLDNYPGAAGYWEIQDFTFEEVTEAVAAQTTATNAASSASTANTELSKISSDAWLSKSEKPALLLEWQKIHNEHAGIIASAANYAVASSTYATAKTDLANYLNSISLGWDNVASDSPIVAVDFRAAFNNLYASRQALLDAIAAEAGKVAVWATVSGSGKPADNATVGADASNFTGTIGGDNLTHNSSFESNDGSIGTGWAIYNNAGEGEPTTAQIVAGRTGGNAQQISWTVAHTNTKGVHGQLCNGGWIPFKTYIISFYAKVTALTYGVTCLIAWNTAPASTTTLANPLIETYWQRYAFLVTMGATVESNGWGFISLGTGAGSGVAQFDDIMVVEGDVLSSYYPSTKEAQDRAVAAQTTAVSAVGASFVASANMSAQGNIFTKTSANGWDAGFRSKDAFTGGAIVTFIPSQSNCYLAIGLNTDAAADNNITSIDYAIECVPGGAIYWHENTVPGVQIGTYAVGDVLGVSYDGVNIRYLQNGTALRTVPVVITAPLFADSSFYSQNAAVSNVQFSAMTSLNEPTITNGNITISADGTLGGAGGGQVTTLPVVDSVPERTTDRPPSWYSVGTKREFKQSSSVGLGGADNYLTLETIIQYTDSSGGSAYQYAYRGTTTWRRWGAIGAASWAGAWVQDLDRNAYTGDLDATKNQPDATTNNAIADRISKSANSILDAALLIGTDVQSLTAGIICGTVARTGGTTYTGSGVGVLASGLFGVKNGTPTFSIDLAGNAEFAGKLKASTVEGSVNVTTTGNIRAGKTGVSVGAEEGFFLGYQSSNSKYVFSVGKSGGVGMVWDGSNFTVTQAAFNVDPAAMGDIYVYGLANGPVSHGSRTATPVGGVAPYTYAWTKSSSSITLSSTTAISTSISTSGSNQVINGWVKCTVTDSGARVTSYTIFVEAGHNIQAP